MMARRSSLLAPALKSVASDGDETPGTAEAPTEIRPVKRANPNAGKFHVGGYYDPADPTIEAFRVLATRQRRTQQDMLHEAIADLVAKHEAAGKFGR